MLSNKTIINRCKIILSTTCYIYIIMQHSININTNNHVASNLYFTYAEHMINTKTIITSLFIFSVCLNRQQSHPVHHVSKTYKYTTTLWTLSSQHQQLHLSTVPVYCLLQPLVTWYDLIVVVIVHNLQDGFAPPDEIQAEDEEY